MSRRLPDSVRQFVAERAAHRCEYCRVHQEYLFLPFQIDHIASLKHGGGDEPENLAYACPHCNQFKCTDLSTFLESYQDIVALFNPRIHIWVEHFMVDHGEILPKSRIGEATIKTLHLNDPERLIHRRLLMEDGLYP
ncbi:MAG: HNH endonuclease [Saprospiraceae bacterium]|nr:HNH endonuclease [Saprospiraceae bacterium]